jgi:bacillopeptidase F (M6 metalloprotease family)
VAYNVYRSTTQGFTPDGSNLVASCVSGTSFVDTDVVSGETNYYIVRAEDDSGNGSGPCGGGNVDDNVVESSGAATGPDAVYFADDMESGDGNWSHGGLDDTWTLSTARSVSGQYSFYAEDVPDVSDQQLESLEFALPAVPGITLEFWSWQEVEDSFSGCYDGGIVEASTDGGSNWTQLPNSAMLTLPYDGSVSTSFSNPIGGQDAWCGDPRDWTLKIVDLTTYAGQSVKLRFRFATDSSVGRPEGWYIDDVRVITPSECDSTFAGLFADGFESGDTSRWSRSAP